MRYAALSPGGLAPSVLRGKDERSSLISDGIVEMRSLLSPVECEALAPPSHIEWNIEKGNDPTGVWFSSDEYRFGKGADMVCPDLQSFLIGLRGLIQLNARAAGIPELAEWGNPQYAEHRAALVGLKRVVYGAKWHRTPASHQIGWHSDDSFNQANRSEGQVPNRALGLMIAVSLSEHGGAYEYAPADAERNPDGSPCDSSQLKRIEGIKQGDAVGFCTARNPEGDIWNGSFPWHRFIADEVEGATERDISRDSLVVYFRYVADLTLREIGPRGAINLVKEKLAARLADHSLLET